MDQPYSSSEKLALNVNALIKALDLTLTLSHPPLTPTLTLTLTRR